MKKILFSLLCLVALATPALRAADSGDKVALLIAKIDNQDQLLPVIIEFNEAEAPETVANFKKLARKGFYEDVTFHRVFPHTLVQAGDPLSKKKDRTRIGTGGPGYTLQPEIHLKHTKGAVAMSRLPDRINPGRVSSGSQFYVCLAPQTQLDGQYTVFGHVTRGLDNLDKISVLPVDSNDNPLTRAVIKSVKILPRDVAERQADKVANTKPSKFLQFIKSIDI